MCNLIKQPKQPGIELQTHLPVSAIFRINPSRLLLGLSSFQRAFHKPFEVFNVLAMNGANRLPSENTQNRK